LTVGFGVQLLSKAFRHPFLTGWSPTKTVYFIIKL
jgi:hypothetical protein